MTLREFLQTALKTVEDDEAREELQALKDRRFSLADLEAALDDASDDDRERFKGALIRHGLAEEQAEQIVESRGSDAEEEAKGGGSDSVDEPPPPPRKRTRPGRRAGNAYAYRVDDDGRVVKTDTAVVYTGEDEPDEVELPE